MDYVQEFTEIKKKADEKKTEKVQLEERVKFLSTELEKKKGELKTQFGLESSQQAKEYMAKAETELQEGLEKCRAILQVT